MQLIGVLLAISLAPLILIALAEIHPLLPWIAVISGRFLADY